ncbi:amidohydrolase family protein [Desertimonas flava]|uniref:amidohydrolase family protein n=1 Tax=Desertimonas flava TaxID=2064846 RepID=UPI000E34E6C0|nr:amidohydrolase family protein [Desertimonas flava]
MLRLFSADDHIIEHADVWQDRVPSKYKAVAPHVIAEDGREFWVYENTRGETMGLNAVVGRPRDQLNPDPIRFDEMRAACYDPKRRAEDMLADGILASVLFPTLPKFAGTLFLTFQDKELAAACVRAYNDFVIEEWCPSGPRGLFVPTVILPLWDPAAAAREIHRCADNGAVAISFPENGVPVGLPSYWDPYWNPIWRATEERDLTLCLHIGTSGQIPVPSPDAPSALSYSLLQVGSMQSSVNLMMSPVCRLFPKLKFVFSEGGIGWLPNALERADRMWLRHKSYSGFDDVLPSEIFRQNMYLCMIEEPICLKYRDDIGVDKIMWECDYPHTDTVWPESQRSAQEVFDEAGCSPEEIEAITHGNAERVFGWKMADPALATVPA